MGMDDLPHPSLHRSWVEIDLGAVRKNVRRFREAAGSGVMIMPALKANAYGHGAEAVARAALAGGADRFAVATCLEGLELREAGIGVPIQVLGASFPEEVRPAVRLGLILSIHELSLAQQIAIEATSAGKVVPIHLKIDTGMGRLGILPENVATATRKLASYPGLIVEGAFMHFADAGNQAYSRIQLERFRQALDDMADAGKPDLIRHAANTTAAPLHPESRLDLIRPGAGIYGYADPDGIAREAGLESVMAWRSSVIQVKEYPAGFPLGYNRSFITRRPSRIAVLPTGYADGYRREFSNRARVIIRGRRAPVVGIVSMDYAMADVTDMPEEELAPGTVATLLGTDGGERITAEELAGWGGTIPYCVTTGINSRVGRRYLTPPE